MICIGLTGGIGSGKSFIAEIFKKLGVPVYNADTRASFISDKDPEVKSNIVSLFGQKVYSNGLLNRQYVGGMVFDNPDLLERLNSIIHPAVEADFLKWCSTKKEHNYIIKEAAPVENEEAKPDPAVEADFLKWCSTKKEHNYIIKEAAILFETGSYKKLDSTILVVAPEDIRIKRVLKRDNTDRDSVKKRVENQWGDQEKEKLANYIINNDGRTLLLPQIINIHNSVTE